MPKFQPASSRVGNRQSPGRITMTAIPTRAEISSLECSRATRIGKGRSFGSGEADFSGAMAPLLAVADDPAKPVRRWSGQDARIPAPAK